MRDSPVSIVATIVGDTILKGLRRFVCSGSASRDRESGSTTARQFCAHHEPDPSKSIWFIQPDRGVVRLETIQNDYVDPMLLGPVFAAAIGALPMP